MLKRPLFSSSKTPEASTPEEPAARKAYVIVLGNEKGGSGKTTTCMHLIISLLRLGFTVGSIDIDSRQRSLSRYLENRRQTMLKEGVTLPQPQHIVIQRSPFNIVQEAEEDERERFTKALQRVGAANDFVVIDSPGSDTFLARVAHAHADTIITPINDSFVDLDVLANVDGQTMKIIKPSIYSEMVWEQKLQRAKRDGGSIEWIVMRNRLSNIDAKNKRFMTQVTTELSRRIGFRVAPGFSERVIFREMFLQGLTVLDIMETSGNASLSLSHVAARQEVRDLLKTLQIPLINERLKKPKSELEAEKKEEEAKAKQEADKKAADEVIQKKAAEAAGKPDNYDTVPLALARQTPDVSKLGEDAPVAVDATPSMAAKQTAADAIKKATEALVASGKLSEEAKSVITGSLDKNPGLADEVMAESAKAKEAAAKATETRKDMEVKLQKAEERLSAVLEKLEADKKAKETIEAKGSPMTVTTVQAAKLDSKQSEKLEKAAMQVTAAASKPTSAPVATTLDNSARPSPALGEGTGTQQVASAPAFSSGMKTAAAAAKPVPAMSSANMQPVSKAPSLSAPVTKPEKKLEDA